MVKTLEPVEINDHSERVEYALTKAQTNSTVEQVEVFLGTNLLLTIRAAVGKILESKIIQDAGVGIRIITKDHGVGFSSTCDLSNQAIIEAIKEAISLARYRKVDTSFTFPIPKKSTNKHPFFDNNLKEAIFDYQKINEQINQLLQETMDINPAIKEAGGPTHLLQYQKHIMNSNGSDITEMGTYWTQELFAIAESQTEARDGSESNAGWRLSDFNKCALAHHAADMALTTLGGKNVESGSYDIILSPVSVATFLQGLTQLLLPQNQEKHMSVLKDRISEQIASPLVSIVNNPLEVPCPVSGVFDDEGTPTQNLSLIENGIFKNMPVDSSYAHQFTTTASGNGYRIGTITDWLPGMTVYPG